MSRAREQAVLRTQHATGWHAFLHAALLIALPERGGGRLDFLPGIFEHLAHPHGLLLSQLPLLLFDALANAGQSLHAVTGVEPRRINQVTIPRTPWKPIR